MSEKRTSGMWVQWCPDESRWSCDHDQSKCESPEHIRVVVTPEDACVLLNALRRAYRKLMAGDMDVLDQIQEAYESVTSEEIYA